MKHVSIEWRVEWTTSSDCLSETNELCCFVSENFCVRFVRLVFLHFLHVLHFLELPPHLHFLPFLHSIPVTKQLVQTIKPNTFSFFCWCSFKPPNPPSPPSDSALIILNNLHQVNRKHQNRVNREICVSLESSEEWIWKRYRGSLTVTRTGPPLPPSP